MPILRCQVVKQHALEVTESRLRAWRGTKDEAQELLRQTSQERSLQGGDGGDIGAIALLTRGNRGGGGKGFEAQGTSWSPLCTGATIEVGSGMGSEPPAPIHPSWPSASVSLPGTAVPCQYVAIVSGS